MSFNLIINGEVKTFEEPIKLIEFTGGNKDFICAKVNSNVRELNYEAKFDAEIKFLTANDSEAIPTYRRTLIYVFLYAANKVFPNKRFRITFSVSRSIYAEDLNGKPVSIAELKKIEEKMKEIVAQDISIVKGKVSKEEAIAFYKEYGLEDKIKIIKYRPEEFITVYKCKNYRNYMYGYLMPSTGYLKSFKLFNFYPGIIMTYPRSEAKGDIPDFVGESKYALTLLEAQKFGKKTDLSLVGSINKQVTDQYGLDLINICEAKHNNLLCHLGDKIEKRIDTMKLICIAGPSSSGKTTFANRLCIDLRTRGINPVRISLDDYYLDKDKLPKDEYGEVDYEHIEALDIDLFNQNLIDLLEGKEVRLPQYVFKTRKRKLKDPIKISDKQPIVIEGIHALNEKMTYLIPKHNKYKIYIAPHFQLNYDNDNPISMTDLRKIRRLVRDFQFRKFPAEETLSLWPSVRRGEFKWIYESEEQADFVFDSFLPYEPCVLKSIATNLLKQIPADSQYFHEAKRLINILKYFKDVDPLYVPSNSILKEFIGGSSFES